MEPVICFLIALFIHEGFHLLAGIITGERFRVRFLPGGFSAVWKNYQPEKWTQCFISASGPAGNLITAAVLRLLSRNGTALWDLAAANLFLGLFNLIPLYPMDGGSILLVLLYDRIGAHRTVKLMKIVGKAIRLLLLGTGSYMLIAYRNPSLFLSIALLPGIQTMKRSVNHMNLNAIIRRKERILKKRAYPVRHILVLKDVSLGEAMLLLDHDRYHILHVADYNLNILRQVTEKQLLDEIIGHNAGKTLEEAFKL